MTRYGFWLLLGGCLLAIGALYMLEVRRNADQLAAAATRLHSHADKLRAAAKDAVGRQTLDGLRSAQAKAKKDLERVEEAFERRDAENLDLWFPDLDRDWSEAPIPGTFQVQYANAQDRLTREVRRTLQTAGGPDVPIELIDEGPLKPSAYKTVKELQAEMRRRQREFWVQSRLLLAFARQGAWPTRALRAAEADGVTTAVGDSSFRQLRFNIQVAAKQERVLGVLHAFDSPFPFIDEDGVKLEMAISAVVENISIRARQLDEEVVKGIDGEPPVLITFYISVLDYER